MMTRKSGLTLGIVVMMAVAALLCVAAFEEITF